MKAVLYIFFALIALSPASGSVLTSVGKANAIPMESISQPMEFAFTGTVLRTINDRIIFADDTDGTILFHDSGKHNLQRHLQNQGGATSSLPIRQRIVGSGDAAPPIQEVLQTPLQLWDRILVKGKMAIADIDKSRRFLSEEITVLSNGVNSIFVEIGRFRENINPFPEIGSTIEASGLRGIGIVMLDKESAV